MMQRERELEGDQFKDKESFVTQAYKDQMEQVRKAEVEEKRREGLPYNAPSFRGGLTNQILLITEIQKKQSGPSTGMAHFYRKLLEESEQQHEATVAATQVKPVIGPQGPTPNLTIIKPSDLTLMSDLELARVARDQGKEVEINDDGQIVDKRDLLSAGLNLSLPNTRRLGKQSQGTTKDGPDKPVETHTAVGTAASRREINERRRREILHQMEMEKIRVAGEKQQEDDKSRRIVAKRNTESDVSDARERYMARKRQKLLTQDGGSDNNTWLAIYRDVGNVYVLVYDLKMRKRGPSSKFVDKSSENCRHDISSAAALHRWTMPSCQMLEEQPNWWASPLDDRSAWAWRRASVLGHSTPLTDVQNEKIIHQWLTRIYLARSQHDNS